MRGSRNLREGPILRKCLTCKKKKKRQAKKKKKKGGGGLRLEKELQCFCTTMVKI